jgi:hypothetical protein
LTASPDLLVLVVEDEQDQVVERKDFIVPERRDTCLSTITG